MEKIRGSLVKPIGYLEKSVKYERNFLLPFDFPASPQTNLEPPGTYQPRHRRPFRPGQFIDLLITLQKNTRSLKITFERLSKRRNVIGVHKGRPSSGEKHQAIADISYAGLQAQIIEIVHRAHARIPKPKISRMDITVNDCFR